MLWLTQRVFFLRALWPCASSLAPPRVGPNNYIQLCVRVFVCIHLIIFFIQVHTILLGKVFVIMVKSNTLCALTTVYEVVAKKHVKVIRPDGILLTDDTFNQSERGVCLSQMSFASFSNIVANA